MTRKTTITMETTSLTVLRATGSTREWCSRCGAETEMIPVRNLGIVSNLDRQTVEQWLNSGELHRCEAADGSPIICLNSLLARLVDGNPAERGLAQAYKETK